MASDYELRSEECNWRDRLRLNGKLSLCTPVNQTYVLPIERKVRVGGTRTLIDVRSHSAPGHASSIVPASARVRSDDEIRFVTR